MNDLVLPSMQMTLFALNSIVKMSSRFNLHRHRMENLTSTIYFLLN